MKKTFLCFICTFLIIFSLVTPTLAFNPSAFQITAESAIMASLDTGDIVYSKDSNTKRYPASLTKIMTALLILENTKDLDNEIITVSDYAINSLLGTGSSVGGLKIGEKITARQMLYYLLMVSANDGAMAVAEHYGKTVEGFVEMMNKKAAELGMKNSHFMNPHGLHHEEHYTTAYDVLLLARAALKYNAFKEAVSSTRYNMPATNLSDKKLLVTTNMLQDPSTVYFYKYASGVKTGYTDEAGRCLVSTAEKDGYSYIVVLMKCPVVDNGRRVRYEFNDSKQLYEWMFNEFEYKSVYETSSILGEAKVDLSFESDHVALVPKTSLSAILPKAADLSTVKTEITLINEVTNAPVKKGDLLGYAKVSYAGEELGNLELIAADSVEGSTILLIWHYIVLGLKSDVFKYICIAIGSVVAIFVIYVIIINSKHKKRKRRRY